MPNLNETVSADRVHIGFFGRRNVGKSSLVNAVTGQNLAVVSDVRGTTTDPVKKAMELLPIGPVLIIDTPGFDDEGTLGEMRVQKTREILAKTDIAVLVTEAGVPLYPDEKEFLAMLGAHKTPYLHVYNKSDARQMLPAANDGELYVSAQTGVGIAALKDPPRMVITDSQAFGRVAKDVPPEVSLTSFSILFARYKGDLLTQVQGAAALANVRAGDKVLISEGCTHHRQCGDIGTVKLPALIKKFTGITPDFTFTSGGEFPADVSEYKLVIHCGACMLGETEMAHRLSIARECGTPVVNYGVAIAHMNGILRRSLALFPDAAAVLD